ncbi:MAG: glycine betaine ABC transporter substrate-binding protein, partial [Bryobacteraceae bacterium]
LPSAMSTKWWGGSCTLAGFGAVGSDGGPWMDRRMFVAGLMVGCSGCFRRKKELTVGSKEFTEQTLLGEIISEHLERRLGARVRRRLNLSGTLLAEQALLAGEIEMYPEYSGAALTEILKDPIDTDPAVVLDRVRLEYRRTLRMEWLSPLGMDSRPVLVMRADDAARHHLETISDAVGVEGYWRLGAGHEFLSGPDGYAALTAGYTFDWVTGEKNLDPDPRYKALQENQVNIIAGNATDGRLLHGNFKVLVDDKSVFPPYQACVVARSGALEAAAGLRPALEELAGKFNSEKMQKMNYEVDVARLRATDVAAEFLRQAGLG